MDLFLQLLVNGLIAGALYSLVATSFGLIYGATRHFHIAHAAVFASAGYSTAVLASWGMPVLFAAVGGIAFATALGCVIEIVIYEPLLRRLSVPIGLFIASLGLLFVTENAFALRLGTGNVSVDSVSWLKAAVHLGVVSLTRMQLILILWSVVVLVGLLVILRSTALGAKIRALSGNPELMRALGRRPEATQRLVYLVGSFVVATGGAYVMLDTGITTSMGERYVVLAIAAVLIGGVGSIGGAFVAAILLGLVQNLLQFWMPSQWTLTAVFALFLVIIATVPQGLSGAVATMVHQRRLRPRAS